MKKLTAADPETKSPDVQAENLAALRALFPELVTEGPDGVAVNLDVLKQLVGDRAVTDAEEKYGLNWYGKRRARQLALTPSTGTLRPCPEDSVDWATTQNLMIEGDNLEVLKLLQKSYAGKVKLIYIDPPYNTGNDFVYPDNFQDSIKHYLELTGQTGDGGRKLSSNTEASGRFHTDWLNMMYPRLKLARALMRADGVIYISMDEREVANVRKLCDEVFGEENFVTTFIWEKRTNRENRRVVSTRHDNVVCYCRDASRMESAINQLPMSSKALANYKNPDNDPRGPWKSDPAHAQAGHGTKSQFYTLTAPNGKPHDLESGRCWVLTKTAMTQAISEGRIWFGRDGNGVPRLKTYLEAKERGLTPETIWFAEDVGTNESAKNQLKELFGGKAPFDTPKPVDLVRQMILLSADDGIVLDFFAGSGVSGHAVMAQNAEDGGTRRYILVQLPELNPENSEPRTLGLRTIAETTKERLRLAGTALREENPMFSGDLGFRVFKLASSNIRAWEPDRDQLAETLEASIEHLKSDRTEHDILVELLLKLGLDLCVPIETKKVEGDKKLTHDIHSIGSGSLFVCLSPAIPQTDVEPVALGLVAWHKALKPAGETTVVFRDSAFADDVAKANLTAILLQNGLKAVRSL